MWPYRVQTSERSDNFVEEIPPMPVYEYIGVHGLPSPVKIKVRLAESSYFLPEGATKRKG